MQAELGATAPGVLGEVVAELVTGLAEGFGEMVAGEGLPPGTSPGGVCQLWLEARYLAAAVAGLAWPALMQALQQLEAALAARLQAAIDHAATAAAAGQGGGGGDELGRLRAWCGAAGAGARGKALAAACAARVQSLSAQEVAASAANLAPLRLLGGPPAAMQRT